MPKAAIYNRNQFKPFADALIDYCARNANSVGFFNENDLQTTIKVEQVHGAYRLWWENGHLLINQPACDYLKNRGARLSVPVLME